MLHSYLTDSLLHRLERGGPNAPAAESIQALGAVIIVDISGFTLLTERFEAQGAASAESLNGLLNDYFDGLVTVISESGGEAVEFSSDAALAMWPVASPEALRDATLQAACCALSVQAFFKSHAAAADVQLRVHTGIAAGEMWRSMLGGLATVMNSVALQDGLETIGIETRVQTSIEMRQVAEPYIRRRAIRHLEKKRVVIFAAGTGNPYFSTDTTAALRAAEIEAEVILMAKNNVDGVYTADPKLNKDAKKYESLSYMDMLNEGLGVMDATASSLSMDNDIPLIVFSITEEGNIKKVVRR